MSSSTSSLQLDDNSPRVVTGPLGRAQPALDGRRHEWKGEWWQCYGDCSSNDYATCAQVALLPCIPFGDVSARLGPGGRGRKHSCTRGNRWTSAILFGSVLACFPIIRLVQRHILVYCAERFPDEAPESHPTVAGTAVFILTGIPHPFAPAPPENVTVGTYVVHPAAPTGTAGQSPSVPAALEPGIVASAQPSTGDAAQPVAVPAALGTLGPPGSTLSRRHLMNYKEKEKWKHEKWHNEGPHSSYPACTKGLYDMNWIMVLVVLFVVVIGASQRIMIREDFKIGTPADDCSHCLLWLFCWPCALCQEHRTLVDNRVEGGVWPTIGEAQPFLSTTRPAVYSGMGTSGGARSGLPPSRTQPALGNRESRGSYRGRPPPADGQPTAPSPAVKDKGGSLKGKGGMGFKSMPNLASDEGAPDGSSGA